MNRSIRPVVVTLLFAELMFWVFAVGGWSLAVSMVPSLTLHRWEMWPLLLATGLPTLGMVTFLRWRHRAIAQLADNERLPSVFSAYRLFRPAWRFLLWRWALGAAVIGWLDPKMGSRLQDVESEGVDVMVALDVSNSMLAEDVGMPRLDLAKRGIERLISASTGDRIGLVVFAGSAYVQCPLTTDVEALKLFLGTVNTNMVPTQGTAVGTAIDLCMASFDEHSEASKMIVVLTDGENHEDDVVAAASQAKDKGASIHFWGIGSPEGSPIPTLDRRGRPMGFRNDNDGNPVVSRLDEATLLQATQAGGGTYVRATRGFVDLSPFLQFKEESQQAAITTVSYVDYEHHLMPWLIACTMLLLLETIIPKGRLLGRRVGFTVFFGLLWLPMQAQTDARTSLIEGTQAFREGDFQRAGEAFGQAIPDDPLMRAQAAYNEGSSLLMNQQPEDARAALEEALSLTNDPALQAQIHHNAAVNALLAQEPQRAMDHAKASLRLDPNNDGARHNLALAQRMLQQQQQQDQDQDQDQNQDQNQEQEQEQEQNQDQNQNQEQNQDQNQEQDPQAGDSPQGDSDQDSQGSEDSADPGNEERPEESTGGEPQNDPASDGTPREGQISRADMERILESLERQEAEVQAKLQAAKAQQGKAKRIEKDW